MTLIRALSVVGSASIFAVAGCADEGVIGSVPVPVCGNGGSAAMPGKGAGGAMVGAGGAGMAPGMGGTVGTGGTPDMGGTVGTGGTPDMGGTSGTVGTGGTPAMGTGGTVGTGGTPGTGGSPPIGPCPAGFMCTDLSSFGATATDGAGNPVTASCGNGAPSASCDDANPASTCPGLTTPICAHVSVAGMQLVSCGQRCIP
jgi:hypothetical protein